MGDLALASNGSLVMIDSYGGFELMGNPRSLYGDDGLHLSEIGYGHWNEWVKAAMNVTGNNTDCHVWRAGSCVDGEVRNNTSSTRRDTLSSYALWMCVLLSFFALM